jgi:glycosyltransferase involved in cell wall biosynthesis
MIVGDGPDRDILKKLSKELDVDNFIEFFGYKENVNEMMSKMDIVIIPSRDEAFGLSGIEALASGAYVVAFAVGGLKEVLSDCPGAELISPGDIHQMAEIILKIWEKYGKTRNSKGSDYVRDHFSVARMVNKLEDIYQDVYIINK